MLFDLNNLWSTVLSLLAALTVLWVRATKTEINDIRDILYKTREESAREYVTREDLKSHNAELNKRLDRLEEKIDTIVIRFKE